MGFKYRLFQRCFPEHLARQGFSKLHSACGIVLMYHEVLPDEVDLPAWTVVRESEFQWQMHYLRRHFDIVTPDEALERIKGRSSVLRPFAVVTFDDGYSGNLKYVLPRMKALEAPFAVYAATQAIEEGTINWYDRVINLLRLRHSIRARFNMINGGVHFDIPAAAPARRRWERVQKLLSALKELAPSERSQAVEEIARQNPAVESVLVMLDQNDFRDLVHSGLVTVGCHTHEHELLDQLSDKEISATIEKSRDLLCEWTGSRPVHFSYPNGNYNSSAIEIVRKMGFKTAVTTQRGIWSNATNPFAIPRIGIGRFDSRSLFKAKVSGHV